MATQVNLQFNVEGASLVDLRNQLKDLKNAMAEATDPQEMANLAAAAGEVKDRMKDVNEQMNEMAAGSPFEKVKNNISGMKAGLMDLDFEKVAASATNLANNVGKISFKSAIGGIKNMGTAFAQVGKALLVNPIFLIAAAIAAAIALVMIILNKLGLMKPIMDGIKKILDAVVGAFEALTDAMGLTNHAAQEAAEAQQQVAEAQAAWAERAAASTRAAYDATKNFTEAQGDLYQEMTGAALPNIRMVEDYDIEASKKKIQRANAVLDNLKAKGEEETEEYKKALDERDAAAEASRSLQNKIVADRITREGELDKQLKQMTANSIANERDRAKAVLAIQQEESLAKLAKLKKDAEYERDFKAQTEEERKKAQDTIDKIAKLELLTKKDFQRQVAEIDKKANEKAAADRKKAADDAQAEVEKKTKEALDKLRNEYKIRLLQAKEGTQQYLDIQLEGLNKEQEYVKNNAKNLKLRSDEVNLFVAENLKQREKLQEEFNDKIIAATNAAKIKELEAQKAGAKTIQEVRNADQAILLEQLNQQLLAIQDRYAKELEGLDATSQKAIDIKTKQKDEETVLENNYKNAVAVIRKEEVDDAVAAYQEINGAAMTSINTRLSAAEFEMNQAQLTNSKKVELVNQYYAILKEALDAEEASKKKILDDELKGLQDRIKNGEILSQTELARVQSIEAEKAAIEEEYRQKRLNAEAAQSETLLKKKGEEIQKFSELASQGLESLQAISDAVFTAKQAQLDEQQAQQLEALETQQAAELAGYTAGTAAYDEKVAQQQAATDDLTKAQAQAQEELAKKQFDANKKMQLAGAIVDGFKAVTASLASAPVAVGVVPNPAGIASLAFAITTSLANIAKIAATQYQGGGSSGGGPSAASPSISSPSSGDTATPSINLFGQGNDANTETFGKKSAPTFNVVATVSETDMTATQKRVAAMQANAEL